MHAPSGYTIDGGYGSQLRGSVSVSPGLGAEVGWELGHLGNGLLEFVAEPLFFAGPSGSSWSVPLGLAYRSR
jgi:hypothetical protein